MTASEPACSCVPKGNAVEIYKEWAPETCLGCGGNIVAGDIVTPVDRGWLLCIGCSEDYMLGIPLRAWRIDEDPQQRRTGEAG